MKKIDRKTKTVIITLIVLLIVGVAGAMIYQNTKCRDIMGEGSYMGEDLGQVVIGNTCD